MDSMDENVKVGDFVLIGNGIQQFTVEAPREPVDVNQAPLGLAGRVWCLWFNGLFRDF